MNPKLMEAMKKEGRNLARAHNQSSASQPKENLNFGEGGGSAGKSGRGYKKRKTGVYRSPE